DALVHPMQRDVEDFDELRYAQFTGNETRFRSGARASQNMIDPDGADRARDHCQFPWRTVAAARQFGGDLLVRLSLSEQLDGDGFHLLSAREPGDRRHRDGHVEAGGVAAAPDDARLDGVGRLAMNDNLIDE